MSLNNNRKTNELQAWCWLLEDDPYRLDQPAQFYESLIERADELVFQQVLSLDEWHALKRLADEVYSSTISTLQVGSRDRLDTRVLSVQILEGDA